MVDDGESPLELDDELALSLVVSVVLVLDASVVLEPSSPVSCPSRSRTGHAAQKISSGNTQWALIRSVLIVGLTSAAA